MERFSLFVNLSGIAIKRFIALGIALSLGIAPVHAATKKPSPTPSVKATAKATTKATATKKAVVKKPVVKKKPVKKTVRKKVSVSPSPKAIWPPLGFKANGEVFAKIPTAKELIGTASNSTVLTRQLAQKVDGVAICEKYSCGAVQVASLNGCTWWEITGNLVGETSATDKTTRIFGTIRALVGETTLKQVTTVLLISQEPLELKHAVTNIAAYCHHDATSEKIPSTSYKVSNN